ncbi:MAG: hypothetical protein NXI20_11080 [bacterium]|nr:hypothetical protein [bacterium]
MHFIRISLQSFLFLITLSCGHSPSVEFEEPQPNNKTDLQKIPIKLRGSYFDKEDSSYMVIDKTTIWKWSYHEFVSQIDSLEIDVNDSSLFKEKNTLIDLGQLKIKLELLGDSIYGQSVFTDTIFSIKDQKIRKLKGHYMLNSKLSKNNWHVSLLSFNNRKLSIRPLVRLSEIETLKEITDIDTVMITDSTRIESFLLSPSKKELKQILKLKSQDVENFRKLSKSILLPPNIDQSPSKQR